MDPLGFALENFDALGAWRAQELGAANRSGRPTAGRPSLSRARRAQVGTLVTPSAFTRCLAEKMLTYALGRGVDQADRFAVEEIVRRLARNEYRFSELVLGIVESEPF